MRNGDFWAEGVPRVTAKGRLLIRTSSPGKAPLQISELQSKTDILFNSDCVFLKGKHHIVKAQKMLTPPSAHSSSQNHAVACSFLKSLEALTPVSS